MKNEEKNTTAPLTDRSLRALCKEEGSFDLREFSSFRF